MSEEEGVPMPKIKKNLAKVVKAEEEREEKTVEELKAETGRVLRATEVAAKVAIQDINTFKKLQDRAEKIKGLRQALEKKFGTGALSVASEAKYKSVARIRTGLTVMDWALGGGIPKGRISLLLGEPSACKSRLLYSIIAEAQRMSIINDLYLFEEMPEEERIGYNCLLVDIEGSFDPSWAVKCGINPDTLHIARPQTQEEAAEVIIAAVASGVYDFIGIDAIDGMVPEDDIEASLDEATMGTAAAKNNNKIFRKIQSHLNRYGKDGESLPTLVFLNQLKTKIGGGGHGGPRKTCSGGTGQVFYSAIIVELSPGAIEYFDDKEKQDPRFGKFYGFVKKNKVSKAGIHFNFLMAFADDPKGQFKQAQFGESAQVYDFALRSGAIEEVQKTPSKKVWTCFGEEYSTRSEMMKEWFLDPEKLLILKRKIIQVLCPLQ